MTRKKDPNHQQDPKGLFIAPILLDAKFLNEPMRFSTKETFRVCQAGA